MSFVETCRQVIGLDSTPSQGTRDVGEYFATLCRDAGLHVQLDHESLNGVAQVNLIARPGVAVQTDEVMLQTAMDTAEPGAPAAWTKTQANPFSASIYGDELYGLGAANTKLDFLCKLEAVKGLDGKNLKRPFVLVGTYGAQLGMAGAVKLMRKKMVDAKLALVGSPTNLHLVHAGQGLAVVEIAIPFSAEESEYRLRHDSLESGSTQSKMFVGKPPFAAPTLSENAIVKMLEYLVLLPSGIAIMDLDGGAGYNTIPTSAVLEIDVVGSIKDPIVNKIASIMKALREMESELSQVNATLNIGSIRTFPDHVRLTGCCRLPPSVHQSDYEGWIADMREDCEAVGGVFAVKDYKAAFQTPSDSLIIKTGQKVLASMGQEAHLTQGPSSTEANVFSRFGVECVVVGPGQGVGNSQAPNESIKLSELHQATEFYRRMLEELCL